ncbi:MAG: PAS domain-containing protein [Phenylobacterium sp.]|uniref:sensor histidine kinase n=1 Tax=Phenylobacterium sp. TaxID=1871053 RepID=UPI001A5ECEDC|nr:HWE histidine kinase domain-containing protein [Phenylobacterium sp.]MBL8774208.1 PAS domain-containing protein [Phenylobacterium sp.]
MASSETPEAELRRLRARVAELEAELSAKPTIDRASLYRTLESAPWGVMALSVDGRIDVASRAAQRWLAVPAPAFGVAADEALLPALREALEAPLAAAFEGHATEGDVTLRDIEGEVRALRLLVSPRASGPKGITGAVVTLYDVTETQALDRTVRENEARLTHINAVTPTANYIFDFLEGRVPWAAGMMEAVYGVSAEAMQAADRTFLRGLIHPEDFPRVMARVAALAKQPDGVVMELELRIRRADGSYRWILDRGAVFERDAAGRVAQTLNAAIDIDERKRAEERRSLLINELNHRVKNTLAAVQSIARQSLRSGRDPAEMSAAFTSRLVSLSAAHDILTREHWEGAAVREIVQVALAPFDEARIQASGAEVRLGARAAIALSMALHELATNAAKYGALSGDAGRVILGWRAHCEGEQARFELEWREVGGPPVTPPRRRGFGWRLLSQGLRADLNGEAELHFDPEGVVCRISAPLETAPRPDQI